MSCVGEVLVVVAVAVPPCRPVVGGVGGSEPRRRSTLPVPAGRPATDRTQGVSDRSSSGPEASRTLLSRTERPERAKDDRGGGGESGGDGVANWSLQERSSGSGRNFIHFFRPAPRPVDLTSGGRWWEETFYHPCPTLVVDRSGPRLPFSPRRTAGPSTLSPTGPPDLHPYRSPSPVPGAPTLNRSFG